MLCCEKRMDIGLQGKHSQEIFFCCALPSSAYVVCLQRP